MSSHIEDAAYRMGRSFGTLLAECSPSPRRFDAASLGHSDIARPVLTSNAPRAETASGGSRSNDRRSGARRRGARAVFIGHDAMLRLANARAIPEGRTVPRNAQHPAGIQLFGVKALGIGMEDGDVLTEVEGRSVSAEQQVVTAVMVALARHASTLSATFFRKCERWSLVVEIPYDARPD